jgi:hypothetical protein
MRQVEEMIRAKTEAQGIRSPASYRALPTIVVPYQPPREPEDSEV